MSEPLREAGSNSRPDDAPWLWLGIRYGGAVAAVTTATALRWLLQSFFGQEEASFITFFPTVALVAILAGGGPGVLATLLSAAVVHAWQGFGFGHPGEALRLVMFVLSGLIVSAMAEMMRDREERLAAIMKTAQDAIITIDRRGLIRSVNPAAERMFGYAAAEMVGHHLRMLVPSPHQQEFEGALSTFMHLGVSQVVGPGREVVAQRKDGTTIPVELTASEAEHPQRFIGILRDITRRKALERDLVETQRRIGQDLHDSVGQELTALTILAADLADTVRSGAADTAPLLDRLAQGLRRIQSELRVVMRGLHPVAVDQQGLMAALSDLADRTCQEARISCTFDCAEPVALADNFASTQLYFIAQEAVHNAIKHAQPRSIGIALAAPDHLVVLQVRDDGIGMPAPSAEQSGLGLRIMRHRAGTIGATLTFERAPTHGTVVTCMLPRRNDEREKGQEARPGSDHR